MQNLEYFLGNIELNPQTIMYAGSDPYKARHKFIVELRNNNEIYLHISQGDTHEEVRKKMKIPKERVIGGGSTYINKEENLFFGDHSGDFKSIPLKVAEDIAQILIEEMKKREVKFGRTIVSPNDSKLNLFWINLGYKQREPKQYTIDDSFPW